MELIEFQWLSDYGSLKEALKLTLGSSGQLIKRHFSSKEQTRPVRKGDVSRLPLDFVNHLHINPSYQGPPVKILEETDSILALHKPANIHCHPLCYSDQDTLLNALIEMKQWSVLKVNSHHYDRGLLYRLHYETSGLMLLAKNQETYETTRSSFDVEIKRKFYWAIVEGDFDQQGTWSHWFKATGLKGSKQKVSRSPSSDAQEGIFHVQKVLTQGGKSLLLVQLKTGLRHQIRAQLSELGFPILGDELYGGVKSERLFLHALRYEWKVIIEDPTADLFDRFFDLNRALQMSHDMIGRL